MPTLYRGAPIGSYWHGVDATKSGFTAQDPRVSDNVYIMMDHIQGVTTVLPYISLTSSYGVARAYAEMSVPRVAPTSINPAYVYMIDLSPPLPSGLVLYDPLIEIGVAFSKPPDDDPVSACRDA